MSSGWEGMHVMHPDGRMGIIVGEYIGFCHRILDIRVDGGGSAVIQLNADGPDTGESGWMWRCEKYDGGPRWLQLGAHADTAAEASA